MAEVNLSAHIVADPRVVVGRDPIAEAAQRLSIQEDIIAHMVKTLIEHGGPIDQETAEIMARRSYFLTVGFLQAAKDFGILK